MQGAIFELMTANQPTPARQDTNAAIQAHNNPTGDQAPTRHGNREGNAAGMNNNANTGRNGIATTLFPTQVVIPRQGAKALVVDHLHKIVHNCFVRPWNAYVTQVKANDVALRITKVAKEAAATRTADKTAELLASEAVVDPKIVKIMIQKTTDKAVKKAFTKEKEKEKKKKTPAKQNTAPKNLSGGARGSAASKKNNTPQPNAKGRKGKKGGAAEHNKDTSDGNSDSGRSRSRQKQRKKQGSSKKKKSKSPAASRKG
jgi:hypothetical protein